MSLLRKTAALLSIVFGAAVLWASTSRDAMERITKHRDTAPPGVWWGLRPWDKGDLARMAYLEEDARFRDTNTHHYTRPGAGNGRVDFYLFGDSYVKDIPDSVFYGLHAYHFARRTYEDLSYELDTSRVNILMIELGERFVRDQLALPANVLEHVYRAKPKTAFRLFADDKHSPMAAGILPFFIERDLFNPAINQNIEYNLFSYNAVTPLREWKAELNARLFRRASGDVAMANDGSRLFLRSTLAPHGTESGVERFSAAALDSIIAHINLFYDHYRAEGFDAVYLSIVPNPATILQPEGYNGLLPALAAARADGRLRMPVIDVYEAFRSAGNPQKLFLRSDTHWSDAGQQIWIAKLNAMLRTWDAAMVGQKRG